MNKVILTATLAIMIAAPLPAEPYTPVSDRGVFLSFVDGRELRNRLYGVQLSVLSNGTIQGSAVGWDISGAWSWQDGYFCREMDWGGKPIPYNCQLVEVRGDTKMRFTVDRGAGDSASFSLR